MNCCSSQVLYPEAAGGDTPFDERSNQAERQKRLDVAMIAIAGFVAGNSTVATLVFNLSEMPNDGSRPLLPR